MVPDKVLEPVKMKMISSYEMFLSDKRRKLFSDNEFQRSVLACDVSPVAMFYMYSTDKKLFGPLLYGFYPKREGLFQLGGQMSELRCRCQN